jgi:transcriptional regulator with XRE-family HTH domain
MQATSWFSSPVTPNGTAIRSFRQARNMSLRTLAELTRRDRGFLSTVERGTCGASEETLRRLAVALGVPVAAINREEVS